MRITLVVMLVSCAVSGTMSGAAHAANVEDMAARAKAAALDERYCEARDRYEELYEYTNLPKHLYNAAEVAYAADDRESALALYTKLVERFPHYEVNDVRGRLTELKTSLAEGPGIACGSTASPTSTPTKSNVVVEAPRIKNDAIGDWNTADQSNPSLVPEWVPWTFTICGGAASLGGGLCGTYGLTQRDGAGLVLGGFFAAGVGLAAFVSGLLLLQQSPDSATTPPSP